MFYVRCVMKRIPIKAIALLMSCCLIFSLPACAKKKEKSSESQTHEAPKSGKTVQENDPFYQTETIKIKLPEIDPEKEYQCRAVGVPQLLDDAVVFEYICQYAVPADLQAKVDRFYGNPDSFSPEEGEALMNEYAEYDSQCKLVYNLDGSYRCKLDLKVGLNDIPILFSGNDGKLMALRSKMGEPPEYSRSYFTYEVDASGNLINEKPIALSDDEIPHECFQLSNGNFVCHGGTRISVFDQDGKKIANDVTNDLIQSLICQGDKIYCYALKDTPEEESSFAPEIIEFDAAAGKFKSESIALSREVPFFCSGRNGVYYVVNNTVEKLDPQNNSNSTLLRWDETDINPTGVSLCNVLSDDEMYALSVVETWDMHFSTTIDPDITLYHMTRAEKNPHAGKKIVEIASFQAIPSILMEQIVEYNKDPQKKSRIVVKDYSDEPTIFPQKEVSEEKRLSETIDKVYLDLKAHTGPDILVNFGEYSQFNSGEILTDLNTLIDGEGGINREDYFDNLFRACEKDGKLYQIPILFSANGMVLNEKYADGKTSWTYEEMVNTKDNLPGNMTLFPETPKAKLLEELLRSTGDKFIDYENEKVSFDDPQFKSILEACMRLGSDRTENQIFWAEDPRDGVLEPKEKLQQGMVAAITCKISDPMDFAEVRDLGGGSSGVMIGAPGCDGMSMQYVTSIAIPKDSSAKDEAWEFIRFLLQKEQQTQGTISNYAFPVHRGACQELMERFKTNSANVKDRVAKDPTLEYMLALPEIDDTMVKSATEMIESIHTVRALDRTVFLIVSEEAAAYFSGQISLDTAVNNIQNRTATVVKERG